jgi:hypothetical protein
MLPIGITEVIDTNEQCTAQDRDECQADKHVYSYYIEYREEYKKCNQANGEITDVLGLESFELNGLVDSFVDFIDA